MKDIHHTCRCTEQQFTFKEWCAWIESHEKAGQNSSEFVALSHNGFDFNIHDVCLTPNRPVRLFNAHCIVEVKTAQSPNGRWDYGLDVNLHNSGHYVGSGFVDDAKKRLPNGSHLDSCRPARCPQISRTRIGGLFRSLPVESR